MRRCSSRTTRRAQVWSLDYTIGFLLFLLTLLAATAVLSRTVLRGDSFDELRRDTDSISDQLMGSGYPADWRAEDIILPGLLTDNRLSMRKAERLAEIVSDDYGAGRRLLSTRFEYALTLQDRNGSLVAVGDACRIGSADALEQKTTRDEPLAYAYYARSTGAEALRSNLSSLNATIYEDDELSLLLGGLDEYDFIVMEKPDLAGVSAPYDAEKAQALAEYVAGGGTLFLIGNVNLTELLSLNLTPVNGSGLSASGAVSNETFLNLSGLTIDDVEGFTLTAGGQRRYEPLASIAPDQDAAARFTYGDGDVYYLSSLQGTINQTGESLLAYIGRRLNATSTRSVADCEGVALPIDDAKHLVTVRRLAAYRGRILILNVNLWEER